jgi:hypothetical protein
MTSSEVATKLKVLTDFMSKYCSEVEGCEVPGAEKKFVKVG